MTVKDCIYCDFMLFIYKLENETLPKYLSDLTVKQRDIHNY